MKRQLLKALSISLLIPILLSSCEMANTRDGWNDLADGAKVPAALAIASGEPVIMLECLDGLRVQFQEGGLSQSERGKVALDMIDLIAVLSDAIVTIGPYLRGEVNPTTLSDINEFFASADQVTLNLIARERLMEAGLHAGPAPMQLFWSILSLASYTGMSYATMSSAQQASFDAMVVEANAMAAEGTNTSFEPLLYQFRDVVGEF